MHMRFSLLCIGILCIDVLCIHVLCTDMSRIAVLCMHVWRISMLCINVLWIHCVLQTTLSAARRLGDNHRYSLPN
jgi:hypothetical protein